MKIDKVTVQKAFQNGSQIQIECIEKRKLFRHRHLEITIFNAANRQVIKSLRINDVVKLIAEEIDNSLYPENISDLRKHIATLQGINHDNQKRYSDLRGKRATKLDKLLEKIGMNLETIGFSVHEEKSSSSDSIKERLTPKNTQEQFQSEFLAFNALELPEDIQKKMVESHKSNGKERAFKVLKESIDPISFFEKIWPQDYPEIVKLIPKDEKTKIINKYIDTANDAPLNSMGLLEFVCDFYLPPFLATFPLDYKIPTLNEVLEERANIRPLAADKNIDDLNFSLF